MTGNGFVGNDWLAGVTNPPWVNDDRFLARWLRRVPGRVVELACHPGYHDETLVGRDCLQDDAQHRRRARELALLLDPSFDRACREAGFLRVSAAEAVSQRTFNRAKAA
jgi:hypothetical protein